jgi:hypothetical protein
MARRDGPDIGRQEPQPRSCPRLGLYTARTFELSAAFLQDMFLSLHREGSAGRDVGSEIEKNLEVATVAGFAVGQMKGQRQATEIAP